MTKKKNPLYVVKNSGVVEEAESWFDLIIKKFDLAPVIDLVERIVELILASVTSYPMFAVAKEWIDQILATIIQFAQTGDIFWKNPGQA